MTVPTTIDAGAWLGKHLEGEDGDVDLARAMLQSFAEGLMSAQASTAGPSSAARRRHGEALARLQDAPDSPSRVRELAAVLDRRAGDRGFRTELQTVVDEAQAAGVDVGSIAQVAWGDRNVQIAGVVGSTVTTTHGQPPPSPAP